MIGISCKQFAQYGCILPYPSASTLVIQELNAIYVWKHPVFPELSSSAIGGKRNGFYIFLVFIGFYELMGVCFVFFGNSISQFVVQGFPDHIQVAVFAKYGWDKQPIV